MALRHYAITLAFIITGSFGCGGSQETTTSSSGSSSVFMTGAEEGYYNAGLVARREGDYERARAEFQNAIDANGRYLSAYLALGSVEFYLRNFESAQTAYSTATTLRDRSVDAWLGLASSEFELNNFENTFDAAIYASELAEDQGRDSHNATALYLLGEAQLQLGDPESATESLELALQTDATNIQARVSLARLYARTGRNSDAVSLLGRASSYDQNSDARLALGELYYELGIYDQAITVLQEAHDLDPENDHLLYYLAASQHAAGEYELAIELASTIIERNPSYYDIYGVRGMAYLESEQANIQLAQADAEYVLSHDSDNYGGLILQGDVTAAQGDPESSRSFYQQALQIDSEFPLAVNHMSISLFNGELCDDFIALVEPRIEREDSHPDWDRQMVDCYRTLGQVENQIARQSIVALADRTDVPLNAEVAELALQHIGVIDDSDIVLHAQYAFEGGGRSLRYRFLVIEALANAGRIEDALVVVESALSSLRENPELEAWKERLEDME